MNILKSGIQKKFVAAALLCASVTSFPLCADTTANWWEKWQDNQAFNEALDELGLSYQLLAENPQKTLTRSADPTDVLYWQKRTMQIYGDADKDIYYLPAIEEHDPARERTAVTGRNAYFPTYYYGEEGATFTFTTSSQPDDVNCYVGLENVYNDSTSTKNVVKLNHNSSTQYTMNEKGIMLLACRDNSGSYKHMDTLVPVEVTSTTAIKHPLFIFGLNTNEEWKTMSQQSTPTGQTLLFDGRSRYVASNSKAKASLNSNILQMLREQLSYVMDYDKVNGLDGSTYLHQPLRGLNVGIFNNCCWSVGGGGRIAIGFDGKLPTATSWGYWHEYGHQNQMTWAWDRLTETTNNILSVSACRLLRGEVTDKSCHENLIYNGFTWDQQAVGSFLASGETHQFDTDDNVFRKLMMFTQLQTSWPDLFPYIGKTYREVYNEGKGKSQVSSNQQKIDFFVVNASKAAGRDLREFFTRWGLGYSADADAQIAALKLPAVRKPSVTYTAAIENTGNERANARIKFTNPGNMVNIAFIANSKTIGPTSLVWAGTRYGTESLYAQVTDERHRQFTVKLHGERSAGLCEPRTMNSAVNCGTSSNITELHVYYDPSDNPDLPAGNYTGNLRLIAQDWHSAEWTGDVNIALSIIK